MLQKQFLLFLILLIFGLDTLGQSKIQNHCHCVVKGKVVDKTTKEPLAGAIIQLDSSSNITFTNQIGAYSFKNICDGKHQITIQILGYKTVQQFILVDHDHENEQSFLLDENHFHLTDVEINIKKLPSVTQKVESLSQQKIVENQGLDMAQLLNKALGLQILQTGHQINKPVLHGMHSNRLLLINNGLRQEGQQWGSEHAPEIDVSASQSISLVKGSFGLRYGAETTAGIIVAESLPVADTSRFNGHFNTGFETNGRVFNTNFLIEHAKKLNQVQLGMRFQTSFKNSGDISTPFYRLLNTGQRAFNYSFQFYLNHPKWKNEWTWSQFNNKVGLFTGAHIGNLTDLEKAIANLKPAIEYTPAQFSRTIDRPYQDIQHNLLKSKWTLPISNGTIFYTLGYQYNFRNEVDVLRGSRNLVQNFTLTTFSNEFIYQNKIENWGINNQLGVQYNLQQNVSSGKAKSPLVASVLIPNYLQNDIGFFAIEKYSKNKFNWEWGGRFDFKNQNVFTKNTNLNQIIESQNNFKQGSFGMGMFYQHSSKYQIQSNFSSSWRAPQVNERYSQGVHHGSSIIELGNPNLDIEKGFNLNLNQTFTGKKIQIGLEGYAHYFSNYIYLAPTGTTNLTIRGAFPVFKYTQTKASYIGFDAYAKINFGEYLNYQNRYNFLIANDLVKKEAVFGIAPNQFSQAIEYQWKGLQFKARHQIVFEQKRIPEKLAFESMQNVTFNQFGGDFLAPPPLYHLIHAELRANLKIAKANDAVILNINNVLNNSYRSYMNKLRYFADEQGINLQLKLLIHF